MSEIDTYKLFRQIEARNKRKNPYKFYDVDELIDIILEKEDEIEKLQNQLQQKENIIKEACDLVDILYRNYYSSASDDMSEIFNSLLEILDKGE